MDTKLFSSRVWQGKTFEARASAYLKQQGFIFVAQNFRSYFGEIDLIFEKASLLIFVEVRQRQSKVYGGALASITRSKQEKIRKTATYFLSCYPKYQLYQCRFDVIVFEGNEQLYWMANAYH